jgi:hypothetical protein
MECEFRLPLRRLVIGSSALLQNDDENVTDGRQDLKRERIFPQERNSN